MHQRPGDKGIASILCAGKTKENFPSKIPLSSASKNSNIQTNNSIPSLLSGLMLIPNSQPHSPPAKTTKKSSKPNFFPASLRIRSPELNNP